MNADARAKSSALSELQNARQWADEVIAALNRGERSEARVNLTRAIDAAKRAQKIAGFRVATWAKDVRLVAEDYCWHENVDSIDFDMWRALSSTP